MWVSWPMVQLFRFKILKKNCMYHNFVFCEGAADTGMRGIHMGLLYNFISYQACIICSMYLVVYFIIFLGYLL